MNKAAAPAARLPLPSAPWSRRRATSSATDYVKGEVSFAKGVTPVDGNPLGLR